MPRFRDHIAPIRPAEPSRLDRLDGQGQPRHADISDDGYVPDVQVTSLDWITAEDLYGEPEAVLAHLRAMVESAQSRQREQAIPGKVVLGVRAAISATTPPRSLKG